MKLFSKKEEMRDGGKKAKKRQKKNKNSALAEKKGGAIAERPEKLKLTDTERRLIALEKKNDPKTTEPFVPYYDAEEHKEEQIINPRYQKISARYRILKWTALAALAAFAVGMIFIFKDQITLENFRYLMRNVDFEIDAGVELDNDLVYVADPDNVFEGYRDYLAVVNPETLTIFDTEGGVACKEELGYSRPIVSSSKKHLLVYDRGGRAYSVYSYFAREHLQTLDYPLSNAVMSDSGVYALVTESRDYEGVVYIYSSGFKLMNRVMKNKRISAVDLTDAGDEVLIAAYYTDQSGRTVSEITVLPTATSESRLLFTVEDAMVYSCSFLEDGSFMLVCSDGVRFYGADGKSVATVTYNEGEAARYLTDRGGLLLVGSDPENSAGCILSFYGKDGALVGEISADSRFIDIVKDGGGAYLLYADRIERVSADSSDKVLYAVRDTLIPVKLTSNGERLFVCTEGMAYIPEKEESES